MSFTLVILWVVLVVGVNSRAYDYGMFDNFFTVTRSPSNDGTAASGKDSNTPALLKGEDVVQKILGARILMPTQSEPTHDVATASRTQTDFTTIDTPTIVDYADQLLGHKRPIGLESFNALERPTRIQRPIQGDPQETHDKLQFSMNPLTDTRAVPTRLLFDNEPITLYEDRDRQFSDYGILTRNPSRTPETTLDDWYRARIVEQTFQEPILRGLTAWAANETITPLLPEDLARQRKGRKRTTTTTPRKTKPKRRRTTTTTTTSTTVYTFTPPCYDTMGYRIRCPNTTTATTFTTDHVTTLPPPTTFTTTPDLYDWENATTSSTTPFNTTFTTTTPINTTTTTPTLSTPTLSDIDQLLAILDNLTYIYDINLVEVLNETLLEEGYPYCKSTQSTTTPEPVTWAVDNFTGTVINKCFVCGMDIEGIPSNSDCADAFASDFFPMSPVDFTSRQHMDRFKKQCRYLDMPKWFVNGTRGNSMWGRWTGGCAVRWMDISGVYTQRTCRDRRRPALGRHFASKRMAKLEYSLFREDNGCIISPQASLVPFSRGVSLYARIHACVCTGNYCNRAERVATLCVRRMVAFGLVMVHLRR